MATKFVQSLTDTIDANYTLDHTSEILYDRLPLPFLACAAYMFLVYSGKKWMKERRAYNLRLLLTLWNSGLAAFSIIGFLVLAPPVFEQLRDRGYVMAVCTSLISERPMLSFWCYLFVYSKIAEFGDTVFIVLRKTPLNFLHWYHHVTVLLYSWYGLATRNTAGHWFCAMNFGVHAVMYSYYMFKAMGFKISSSVAKVITILQLAQFAVGLVLVFMGVWLEWIGFDECGMNTVHIRTGLLMYGSYFILFLNFFYQRYMVPSRKKDQ